MRDFETHTRSGMQLTAFLGSLNLSLRIRSQELEIFESNGTVLDETFIKSTGTSRRTLHSRPGQPYGRLSQGKCFPLVTRCLLPPLGTLSGYALPPPPPLTPGTEGT